MWTSIISTLLGSFSETAAEVYLEKKRLKHAREMEKLKGKVAYEIAKTERAARSEGYDADWETLSIQNSGWKDEATWIVLSIPIVLVFVPGLQPYIAQGFDHLDNLPDWYRWLVVMIYGATFGIRIWRRKA